MRRVGHSVKRMQHRLRFVTLGTAYALAVLASNAVARGIWVSNNSDSGPGSFREAITAANGDTSVNWITFARGLGSIGLQSTVTFNGAQALRIDGHEATLTAAGSAAFDLFVTTGGGWLEISRLGLVAGHANGIVVSIPAEAGGEVRVDLWEVILTGNGLFGLLIDDSLGSPAGVLLNLQRCVVTENGTGAIDNDGLRVNERGPGNVSASFKECLFEANGADGVELDEGDLGDVLVQVLHSDFNENGFLDIEDLEDGIDVDEAGDGDIVALMVDCRLDGNGDEATDLNEDGTGSLFASFYQVTANDNVDKGLTAEEFGDGNVQAVYSQIIAIGNKKEGVKLDESDGGDLQVELHNAYLENNTDDGMQVEEIGAGDVFVRIVNSTILKSKKYGLNLTQGDEGTGLLRLQHVSFADNISGPCKVKGAEVIETGLPK